MKCIILFLQCFIAVSIICNGQQIAGKYTDSYNYKMAEEALKNSDCSAAIKYLKAELMIHEDNSNASTMLSLLYKSDGNYDAALVFAKMALKQFCKKGKTQQIRTVFPYSRYLQ